MKSVMTLLFVINLFNIPYIGSLRRTTSTKSNRSRKSLKSRIGSSSKSIRSALATPTAPPMSPENKELEGWDYFLNLCLSVGIPDNWQTNKKNLKFYYLANLYVLKVLVGYVRYAARVQILAKPLFFFIFVSISCSIRERHMPLERIDKAAKIKRISMKRTSPCPFMGPWSGTPCGMRISL